MIIKLNLVFFLQFAKKKIVIVLRENNQQGGTKYCLDNFLSLIQRMIGPWLHYISWWKLFSVLFYFKAICSTTTFSGFFLRDVTLFPPKKTGEKTRSLEKQRDQVELENEVWKIRSNFGVFKGVSTYPTCIVQHNYGHIFLVWRVCKWWVWEKQVYLTRIRWNCQFQTCHITNTQPKL